MPRKKEKNEIDHHSYSRSKGSSTTSPRKKKGIPRTCSECVIKIKSDNNSYWCPKCWKLWPKTHYKLIRLTKNKKVIRQYKGKDFF